MDRIFLIKRSDESRNPYRVTWVSEHFYDSAIRQGGSEITHYFEDWQNPTQQEVEYFHMIHGDLVLEAYASFLEAFREVLKRFMEDKERYE